MYCGVVQDSAATKLCACGSGQAASVVYSNTSSCSCARSVSHGMQQITTMACKAEGHTYLVSRQYQLLSPCDVTHSE